MILLLSACFLVHDHGHDLGHDLGHGCVPPARYRGY